MTPTWKEYAIAQIRKNLEKHDLKEADINTNYEKGEVEITIKMNIVKGG